VLEILGFQAEPEAVLEGFPVRLAWQVAGSCRVSIAPELGEVDEVGTREVFPTSSAGYTLTAEARDGEVRALRVFVRVLPFPVLPTLVVPTPDRFPRVPVPIVRLAGPAIAMAKPPVGVVWPAIRVAAPPLADPPGVDFPARLAGDGAAQPPAGPLAAFERLLSASATAWERIDRATRVGDVFDRLYARMEWELFTRPRGK
jgi:hypothetical protein